jgi:hypothetical protein
MSTLGKVLVLVHGALALTVLAWAVGVFTNRIDWNTPPAAGGKETTPGLYARQEAKAKEYTAAVDRSYTRWTTNLNQVAVLEAERYPRRTYYGIVLYAMQTGTRPDGKGGQVPVNPPVQDIYPYAPNGYLDVPRDPRTGILDVTRAFARKAYDVRPGIPAKAVVQYDTDMKKQVEDIHASQQQSAQLIAEREKLNKEIVGVTQPMRIKGLRTLITEQKTIQDNGDTEDRYAAVFVTNREAEFGLFKKRRDAMLARVAELNRFLDGQKR